MRKNLYGTALLLLCVTSLGSPAMCDVDVSVVVAKCNPSVVLVRVLDGEERLLATGSGFVVSPGVVATCYHVVAGGAEVRVKTLDRVEYPVAEVTAANRALDLALLRVHAMYSAPALELRGASEVQVGEVAIAMGSPLGLQGTVTSGIVSAVREMGDWGTVIQTSAPVSPGNSGGPLLDSRGRAIGLVMSTMVGGQNVNFALPADAISRLLNAADAAGMSTGPGPSNVDLLKPSGTLDPVQGTWRFRLPRREPYSVALPAYHEYKFSSLAAIVWDNGRSTKLRRVDESTAVGAGSFWVSELGVLWFDGSHANQDIDIQVEYYPHRIAIYVPYDDSGGDMEEILSTRWRNLGDQVVTGADVGAGIAKFASAEAETAAREIGRLLDCSHLVSGTLHSTRSHFYGPKDITTVEVSLTVVDLNTGRSITSGTRRVNFILGRLHGGRDDRRRVAVDMVEELLTGTPFG